MKLNKDVTYTLTFNDGVEITLTEVELKELHLKVSAEVEHRGFIRDAKPDLVVDKKGFKVWSQGEY